MECRCTHGAEIKYVPLWFEPRTRERGSVYSERYQAGTSSWRDLAQPRHVMFAHDINPIGMRQKASFHGLHVVAIGPWKKTVIETTTREQERVAVVQ